MKEIFIMIGSMAIGAITPSILGINNPWTWVIIILAPLIWATVVILINNKLKQ